MTLPEAVDLMEFWKGERAAAEGGGEQGPPKRATPEEMMALAAQLNGR